MATDTSEKFSPKMIIPFIQRISIDEVKKRIGIVQEFGITQQDIEDCLYVPVNVRNLTSGQDYNGNIDIALKVFISRLLGFESDLPDYIVKELLTNPETIRKILEFSEGIYVEFASAVNPYSSESIQFYIKETPVAVEG